VSDPGTTPIVAVDATVVVNLVRAGRLDLLGTVRDLEFVVPDEVVEEVSYPNQAAALARAFEAGHVRQESISDPEALSLYAELRQRMGKGEAACLAMATTYGWIVASDDHGRAFRRLARAHIGLNRVLDIPGIVHLARQQGLLSAEEADRIVEISKR
jgi:predicted nucleic acid-binding protein